MHKEYCIIGRYPGGSQTAIESDRRDAAIEAAKARGLTDTRIMKTVESRKAIIVILTQLKNARQNAELADDRAYTNGTIRNIDTQIAHYRGFFKEAKWTIEDLRDMGFEIWFNKESGLWYCAKEGRQEFLDYDQCISVLLRRVNEKLTSESL